MKNIFSKIFSVILLVASCQAVCNDGEECVLAAQCGGEIVNGQVTYGTSCGSGKVCCATEMNYKLNTPPTCGLSNVAGAGFYGEAQGNNANFAEFPWVASIEDGTNKICTGSLIDKNVVITTASCVDGKNKDSLNVRLGSWTTSSSSAKPETEEIHKVDKIILQSSPVKQFEPNVALLVLKTPANLNMYINPVCLPAADKNFEGSSCKVVGWGTGNSATENLKKSDVTTQSCQGAFGRSLKVPENTICAQLNEKVENGALLVCPIPDAEFPSFQQVGIAMPTTSSGPTIFVNTANFRGWVDQSLKDANIGTDSYSFLQTRFWGAIAGLITFGGAIANFIIRG